MSDSFNFNFNSNSNSNSNSGLEGQCPNATLGFVGHSGANWGTQNENPAGSINSNSSLEGQCPNAPPGFVGHSGANWGTPAEKLTDLQLQALDLTIQGYPDIRISEMLEVDRKTLWRWKMHNEEYRRRLIHMRRQTRARVSDRYHDMLSRAWAVFEESLDHHSDKTRLSAAQSLLHMAGVFKPVEIMTEGEDIPKIQRESLMEP